MAIKKAPNKSHGRSILRIYFLLMTLIGIIGTLVSLGFFLFNIGEKLIITNDEYIVAERYYELDQCTNTLIAEKETIKPSDADIAKCKEEKKAMLIQSRNATFKSDMVGGVIRTILFFVILL